MRYSDPRLIDHLAAAYALGTLTLGARRRFERLAHERADVRIATGQWQARLGTLAQAVPGREPSPRVWDAIAARTRPVDAPQAPGSWAWLRPAGLGLAGLVAGVVATGALLLAAPGLLLTSEKVAMRTNERLPPGYVGVLTDAQGQGKLVVSSLRHGRSLTIKVVDPISPPPAGRLVLWAVPDDRPPFALADVPTSGRVVRQMPDISEHLFTKVSRLAVTAETSLAPTAPTSAPVLIGNCAELW